MGERHERVLDLLTRSDDWVTANQLADRLGVTARSVRNYVTALNDGVDVPLVQSGPAGYRVDRRALAERRERTERDDRHDRRTTVTPGGRMVHILRALTDAPDGLDVHEIANDLYVSESTIESDLGRARARLEGSGLSLRRSGSAVVLLGPETARRRLLGSLFREESARGMLELEQIQREFPTEPLAAFKTGLLERLGEAGYDVNEYGLSNVLLHVAIAVDRVSRDHHIGESETESRSSSPQPTDAPDPLADLLAELVPASFGVTLGRGDLEYLAALLGTRAATPGTRAAGASVDRYLDRDTLEVVRGIVQKAAHEYLIDLDDEDFLTRLAMHVRNLVARAHEQSFSRNPLTSSIKSSYPMIYELAVYIASELQRTEGIAVNEDEIAYIAMHVGAQLEQRREDGEAVTAAVVSPAYHELHLQLLRRLDDAVGVDLTVTAVHTRTDVDWNALPGDIVISSIEPPVPYDRVIVVNPFFGDADAERVRTAIARTRRQRRRAQLAGTLHQYFDESLFFRDLDIPDAESMIRFLGERMRAAGVIDQAYVDGAIERERMSSTAFSDALAVPHAMAMTASRTRIAIVINETPLDWGGTRVHLIAFIAFSESGRASFQNVFDQFVEVFSDRANVDRLVRNTVDFTSFIDDLVRLWDE